MLRNTLDTGQRSPSMPLEWHAVSDVACRERQRRCRSLRMASLHLEEPCMAIDERARQASTEQGAAGMPIMLCGNCDWV
ncbi:hypothetical protein KOW79_010222 [Hemibagrus wyckioides]|uniref:Uncharacterized protein n=1 Tax=Hemibagrus wyckioides TaxID=337641 RepID=A0A9D3NQK8_9TELE|nr:hypothetical protein KOW79_010222 [Hemibagrus wyckioides]